MNREEIEIESWRFTKLSAFARELNHLLTESDYYIIARVREGEIERLAAELGEVRALGRLKVKIQKAERDGAELCSDCPPVAYPTDKTRCDSCPLSKPKVSA